MIVIRYTPLTGLLNTDELHQTEPLLYLPKYVQDMAYNREQWILLSIWVTAVLSFIYFLLIAQQILAWFAVVLPLLFLYLFWRFVRAHERIADALDRTS